MANLRALRGAGVDMNPITYPTTDPQAHAFLSDGEEPTVAALLVALYNCHRRAGLSVSVALLATLSVAAGDEEETE